ncbi:MAG TPA: ATP-binding cassette domain-containing protein, partial [Nocardioides sp.]
MSTDAILQVNGLSKRFGGLKAVDDVSFDVARGQITALIGPNGAGKSTTFNLVTGHNKPDSGTVTFDGHDVTGKKPNVLADKGVARSFQSA